MMIGYLPKGYLPFAGMESADIFLLRAAGFLLFVVGNFIWRVLCEVWVVPFRIHDALVQIENNIKEGNMSSRIKKIKDVSFERVNN